MRFRPIVLAVFLSAASSAAPPAPVGLSATPAPAPDGAAWCGNRNMHRHAGDRPRAEARRLDELPPGNLYLTVWRNSDGCVGPVLVREGYGAMPAPRR